jgi:ABC-type transport system involved in cytochrome c biogenesis permease subunit
VRLILNNPDEAKDLAIFKVLRSDVAQALHLPEDRRYVSYADLLPARNLLELYASRDDSHPATLEMRRLLANVQQYESIAKRVAFSVVVDSKTSVDNSRLAAEVLYHKANFALIAFILAFIACLLASLNMVFKSRKMDVAANVACIATAGILAVAFALRTYVAARAPLSSLYEIVLLVALLLMSFESGAFIFCKRRTFSLMVPVTFMAALLLFFAKFVLEPGDTFRPIPAVLNSSVFLTIHVFTIALGFAGMILSGVVAHLALWRSFSKKDSADSPLESLLYGTLVFGTVFTALGTLLGGVWADFAWGRFWGFDPKECGALFVILWGMLLLHLRAGRLVSTRGFALINCFNVIVTFLCWFGVNLLGVGLHSYGFQGGTAAWLLGFVLADALAIALLASRRAA